MRKPIKLILIFLASLLLPNSCKNYLSVQPQGYVIPSTEEEFAALLDNMIKDVEGGGDEYILGNMDVIARREGCADDLDANIASGSITAFAGEVINSRMTDYRETFELIRNCNIVIENIESRDSRNAKDMLSCAYAIKGICYYNLMRDFSPAWDKANADRQLGQVLVDRFNISSRDARASLKETAEYTLAQLNKSLEFGMSSKRYFFTEWIVKSYIARCYFWTENWSKAAEVCADIINNSGYRLSDIDSYEAMIQAPNDIKGEVITRSHINNSSELDWYFSYVKGYIKSRPASLALIELFGDQAEKDIRFTVGFNKKRICQKVPECRIRLSEIYLMEAECCVHLDDDETALELLNELRSKRIADVQPLTKNNLPPVRKGDRIIEDAEGLAISPMMQAVLDERRRELFLEGDRWFELKRNGSPQWWIINNGLKFTTKEYLYTAPIYKGDVDVYEEIKQNEGYEN